METDEELRRWAAEQSAADAWQAFLVSKPRNGLHLWRVFHAYTRHGLPLPDDVYRLFATLAERVTTAETRDEVERALLLKGRQGRDLVAGASTDKKNYWIAVNYKLLRSGQRKPNGRHLKPSEINQVVAAEQRTTPAQVKNVARDLGLTNRRKGKKIPD